MFKRKTKPSDEDYARLGKNLEEVLIKDYVELLLNSKRIVVLAIVRGFLTGLFGVVGATIGVTLLISLLSLFGGLPLIGEFFKDINSGLQR